MRAPSLIRCLLLAAAIVTAPAAAAQVSPPRSDSALTQPGGWLAGASLGVPSAAQDGAAPGLFTIAAHWTLARPGRLGPDLALGVMPVGLAVGVVAGFARGGVALPLQASPGLLLIPSAGVNLLGAAGAAGAVSTTGVSAGLAAVTTGGPVGLRAAVTVHRFAVSDEAIMLWEMGLVRVPWRR